jgi:hypothetical protein
MKQKYLHNFKTFYAVFGLGKSTLKKAYYFSGLNIKIWSKNIKKVHQKYIFTKIKIKKLGKPLKKYVLNQIKFYFEIKS